MSDLACKTKSMSTPDNLTEAAQTSLVQARGLDKLDKPAILTSIEDTTLDTEQYLSMLGGLTNSSPPYLSRLLPRISDNLQHWITSFTFNLAQSLGGLCTVQGPQNTCSILHGTLKLVSSLHVNPGTGALTFDPY